MSEFYKLPVKQLFIKNYLKRKKIYFYILNLFLAFLAIRYFKIE